MKNLTLLVLLISFWACKNDPPAAKKTNVEIINETTITPELVDSLANNRMEILTELRKNIGFQCNKTINQGFLYFKIKIDSNGAYSDIEVPPKDGLDHEPIEECIKNYMRDNPLDLGIIREMPDSKYGAIPRTKTYTLRVY